jgi:hypothetical protein
MSDSRERFEAWFKKELIAEQWSEEGTMLMFELSRTPGRMYSSSMTQSAWHGWQAAEAQAVRRCYEIATHYAANSSHPMNFAENVAEAIKREFPEAFK